MSEQRSDNRFEALQRTQQNAYQHAPAIRAIYDRAKLQPQALRHGDDLARLPVTSKDMLLAMQRENPPFGGFLAADEAAIKRIFVSPGPIHEPQLHGDQTGHGFSHVFQRAGVGPDDRVLNTWSYHMVPAGLLLDEGIASTGATVIPAGPGNSEQLAQLILELDISCICASTSFFITLIETLERMGHDLPAAWKVRSALLGGEMGDWMGKRRRLEHRYGIRTFSAYATGDFGLIGYEEPGLERYVIQPDRLVQICDPASGQPLPPGQPGEIVVTTLDEGWPLIRFGTGDIATALAPSADGCVGRISQLLGRVGQGVKVREIFIYPRNVEEVLIRVPAIQRAQLLIRHQEQRETAVLRAELRAGESAEAVQQNLSEVFKQITRLKLDIVEWLPPGSISADAPLLMDHKHR